MPTLYYLLPIFNEDDNLTKLMSDISTIVLPDGWNYRICAVNDGSSDKSLEILEENEDKYPLDIISYTPNAGIPTVLKRGFEHLQKKIQADDVVVIMESDGTSDLGLIPGFVNQINKGFAVVIGSRSVPGGAYKNFPMQRKIGSMITNLFLRLLWRVKGVTDYTIFYRAYSGEVLKKYIADGVSFQSLRSFAANGELILRLSKYTDKVCELPLQYDYGLKKGKSKMKLFDTLWEYMKIKR
jgi:dolichol-phosphate mannosyltransferase